MLFALMFGLLAVLPAAAEPCYLNVHGEISQACLARKGFQINYQLAVKELLALDEIWLKNSLQIQAEDVEPSMQLRKDRRNSLTDFQLFQASMRKVQQFETKQFHQASAMMTRTRMRYSRHRPRSCLLVLCLVPCIQFGRRRRQTRKRCPNLQIALVPPLLSLPCFLPEHLKELGEGGFATVWRGRFGTQQVVLKELKVQTAESARQFQNEVRAMLLCAHPHVVTFIGALGSCILMEPMACDLRVVRLYNGLLLRQDLAAAVEDILLALAHMHGLGIAHRDVKPENLLASDRDPPFTIKVADFGLAGHTTGLPTEPVGTLPFMAPELFVQKCQDTTKADVWSFGLVVYFLLYDCLPWNELQLVQDIQRHHIAWHKVPKQYKRLRLLALRCLERKPARRITAMEALGSLAT